MLQNLIKKLWYSFKFFVPQNYYNPGDIYCVVANKEAYFSHAGHARDARNAVRASGENRD